MCSRKGVLGSNPTTHIPFPKVSVARRRLLRNALSKGHHSRYITLFFEGTYSVIGFYELTAWPATKGAVLCKKKGFYELMRMFLVSLMHFLR